ncbi:lysophospholipase L1-like esterase [Roseibium hamelinense]|uniref:Lysophospholipase L1-like esterase n=1 Tax=Roseibium hamelinense TaxID=150831 RepID=A0A562SNH7_9HYPH|nr:SGNH/GDSL hydrolase family protein [Roseibium hamelinense]MTI44054.1 GDSL family lipase [Roseibium hamelinense]TWI82738.1 lysophospholipase L1-like esterase [Roseibium hamelinense]
MPEFNDPVSVVCFGDSLTWGFNPVDRTRYGPHLRWTRLLQKELGESFYIIEEGLNGRTTVFEDPVRGDKNGLAHLATIRKTHMPIDILIIMLGTNDLQSRFQMSAETIGAAMSRLLDYSGRDTDDPEGRAPKTLLVCPPPLGVFAETPFEDFFLGDDRHDQARKLPEVYQRIARLYGAEFFDAGSVVSVSKVDAIHLDPEMQPPLARAIAERVRQMVAS